MGEGNQTVIVNWGTNVVTPAASYKLGRGLGEDEALEFFTFKADHTVDIPTGTADPNHQARPECAQPVEQVNPMTLAGSPPTKSTLSGGQCYAFLGNGTQQVSSCFLTSFFGITLLSFEENANFMFILCDSAFNIDTKHHDALILSGIVACNGRSSEKEAKILAFLHYDVHT